jgi:hypothetical protein
VRPRRSLAALVALLVLLGTLPSASAQQQPGTAEVKRVTGRVEVLRKGQTQWLPLVLGARLAEGDNVRAFSGASAELELPDRSTLLVGENSRIIVTRVQIDPQSQSRFMVFHLVVGKAVATISQATLTLIRARQSNFVITTPTAVAAARGTQVDVSHDADKNLTRVAVIQKGKELAPSVVTCSSFYDRFKSVVVLSEQTVEAGTQGCGTPTSILLLPERDRLALGTAINTLPPQPPAFMTMPATSPPIADTPGLAFAPVQAQLVPAPSIVTGDVPPTGIVPIGVDVGATQASQAQECVSTEASPCPPPSQ